LLLQHGTDLRNQEFASDDGLFFIGDHLGFDDATLERLRQLDCRLLSVGPVSLHSDDVVTLVTNELERRFDSGVSGATAP
jgi:tRNA pseudouridine-54 N-methylase